MMDVDRGHFEAQDRKKGEEDIDEKWDGYWYVAEMV
jgi:hypothetical protein